MQRKSKVYGYFSGGRFGSKDGAEIIAEITLNPSDFKNRTDEQSLPTLAHEMATQPDFSALYVELWDDARKARKAKTVTKTRYTCPSCDMNAWAKPGVRLVCGECEEPIAAEEPEAC